MFLSMAAMLVAALAVPVFGRTAWCSGSPSDRHDASTLYALAARGDRDLLQAVLRIAPWALGGAALIIARDSPTAG